MLYKIGAEMKEESIASDGSFLRYRIEKTEALRGEGIESMVGAES